MSAPVARLTGSMSVGYILAGWQPDSVDGEPWNWAEAVAYFESEDVERQDHVAELVRTRGLNYFDEHITLGFDGVVRDGHHRLCAAIRLGLYDDVVEVVMLG